MFHFHVLACCLHYRYGANYYSPPPHTHTHWNAFSAQSPPRHLSESGFVSKFTIG